MVSDVDKARLNNKMLMSRDQNCSRMMANNTSGCAYYQCCISTAIAGWGLVYQEVGKVRW